MLKNRFPSNSKELLSQDAKQESVLVKSGLNQLQGFASHLRGGVIGEKTKGLDTPSVEDDILDGIVSDQHQFFNSM